MSDKDITTINYDFPDLLDDQEALTPQYFLTHYREFLPQYVSNGRPSDDTLKTYYSSIDQFLKWCAFPNRNPLQFHDTQIRIYRNWLYKRNYKDATVAIKMIAIRCFYTAAVRLNIINSSPCNHIEIPYVEQQEMVYFFTPDQLFEIVQVFNDADSSFVKCRNTAILYLMGVEGLRNVEIHRMNREDVAIGTGSILIRGKGHNRYIYPCNDTMKVLTDYINVCPEPKKSAGSLTPMFLSDSGVNDNGRLSRNGIRYIMNQALEKAGYKKEGVSCHVFRHSVGTNLYAATKDLRLVQETLGHRDPKTTTRYAHLQERMTRRLTERIVPRPNA